ncbi:MAG: ClbS/DfsB family four-helix bundle protein [Pseudomonadota bacterium]
MPAALNKADLISVTETEWDKLWTLLERVPEAIVLLKDDDETSIKDIVAHRAHWIDLFLGWYKAGVSGEDVHFPAEGYKWNDLKRYNRDLRARQADLSWDQAKQALVSRNRTLLKFLTGLSEDDLYAGPMPGAKNTWTTGRWAEAAGPSHYRSAAKYIRQRLKQIQS